jgi:hypothetical protein
MFDDHDDGDEDPSARQERRRLFGYRVPNRPVAAVRDSLATEPARDWWAGPLGVPCGPSSRTRSHG